MYYIFRKGCIMGVINKNSALVNGTLHHIIDLQLNFRATLSTNSDTAQCKSCSLNNSPNNLPSRPCTLDDPSEEICTILPQKEDTPNEARNKAIFHVEVKIHPPMT